MNLHPRKLLNTAFRHGKRRVGCWTHSVVNTLLVNTPTFDTSIFQGNRVAIVGNAPITRDFGKKIDDHDIVIRCNKGILSQCTEWDLVGRKTDICLVGGVSVLMNRRVHEAVDLNPDIQLITPFSLSEREVTMNALIAKLQFRDRIKLLTSETMAPVLSMTPIGFRPSTGFVAMNMVMRSNPRDMNLYGFTFSDYNRIDGRSNQTVCHDFNHEREMAMSLEEDGIISICR